ncbi:hypothetical protein H0H92_000862 [Tricholoma furcatifolium]|nr:hypothetical protein H0H92_000862 [Tricholoma furcatifolium]
MPKDKSEKKDKKRKEAPEDEPAADVEMVDADAPKSPKKAKKEKEEIVVPVEDLSPLAHPLAQKKLVKKLHKTIKKASKARQVKRGVKEVVKGIRKGEKGLLILAADINPIDIISHLPVLSEEAQIPYVFVASKEELGHASSTKRPTSCVMICPNQKRKKDKDGGKEDKDDDYRELYDECYKEVEKLDTEITYLLTMPAAKTKTASTNGTAQKGKSSPAASGTSTPVSTTDKKEALDAIPTLSGGKPDKKVYDAEQENIKKEIDALQAKLSVVRDKVSLATKSGGPGNDRRAALRAELDSIRGQQSSNKTSRGKILDQLKAIQEGIQKKNKDLQTARGKVPFKNVAEVDAHIKNLEKQVESGAMKLADEKRALADISTSRRTRRVVESFQADQDSIEADRAKADELRKQLDDPEFKATSDRYDAIKTELDQLKKESDDAYAGRSKLFEERDSIQAQLNVLFNQKRDSAAQFREANDRYWNKVNEDRARRAERARAQRAAEEAQKKAELADRLLEEAKLPAFQFQIEDCQTLIDFLSGNSSGNVTYKSTPLLEKTEIAGVAKLDIRQVDAVPEGSIVRKKKGEDEEAYFVGKGKTKGKKPAKATDAVPASPSTPTDLNLPLPTLTALLTLSIPPPANSADVGRVIEDLKTKKAWFEANQARVTAENIAKAEKEIQRLTKDIKSSESAGSEVPAEPLPSREGEQPEEPATTETLDKVEQALEHEVEQES